MKKFLLILTLTLTPITVSAQLAITELRWSGSERSTADEWIRIQSTQDEDIDLEGIRIQTRKSNGIYADIHTFDASVLSVGGSILISNFSEAASALTETPDIVTSKVSLPNTKLHVRIMGRNGEIIDSADDAVGAPFAGSKDPFLSMIRIDVSKSGEEKDNWRTEGGETESGKRKVKNEEAEVGEVEKETPQTPQTPQTSQTSPASQTINPDHISIMRIIPRPLSGKRSDQEITIRYTGGHTVTLDGWTLDNREGGSAQVSLDSLVFRPNQTRTFRSSWLGILFTPEADSVRLIDPDNEVISALNWAESEIGIAVLPPRKPEKLLPVLVVESRDARNVRVTFTEESLNGMLPQVERYWSRIYHKYHRPTIGITLESISDNDLPRAGEMIYLDPLEVAWNSPPHITANLYDQDKQRIQRENSNQQPTTCNPPTDPELVIISAYPSPNSDEKEWFTVKNIGDENIDLCGLIIDDIPDGGSAAYTLETSLPIAAGASRTLTEDVTHIRLNNAGDSIRILDSQNTVITSAEFGSTKKTETVLFTEENIEQKISTNNIQEPQPEQIVERLPVSYVNIREDPRVVELPEPSIEDRLISLHEAKNPSIQTPKTQSIPSSNASVAWMLVFGQTVAWIVMAFKRV